MLDVAALTPRQRNVCDLLARGLGNNEIADQLGISRQMVHNHIKAVTAANNGISRLQIAVTMARYLLAEELIAGLDRHNPNPLLFKPIIHVSQDPYLGDYRNTIRQIASHL